jgi:putative transposase
MIDCFDGMVVSWSISTRPDAELVNTKLGAAIEAVLSSIDRPLVHSDRGGHYRWPGWLKNELFYARDWMKTTIDDFTAEIDAYIRWYNDARIKISLGSMSPMEHQKSLGIAI